jgi:hypothetical protein
MERRALGTLVASLESQLASGQARGAEAASRNERGFGALLVSGLTLLALAIDGYHPYAEDGGLYAAGVKRLLDPALYPHATAFVLEPTRLSLFAPVIAGIVRATHADLPLVLLALHLASVWVTLFAAWMLAARCWAGCSARAGAVMLLACWLTIPVAGTALIMMDPYLTARSFSTPATLLALVGAMEMTEPYTEGGEHLRRRGLLLWAGSIVFAAAMHPLMAAYALGATLILLCIRSQTRGVRLWGTAALSGAALILATGLQRVAKPESADYIRVALTRTYWFPAEWHWYELVGLAAPLAILAASAWMEALHATKRKGETPAPGALVALARMAVAVGATAWFVAILFARERSAAHLVARMQPLRAFQVVYLVMLLVLGAKLGERLLRRSAWRWAAAVALLGGTMLGAQRIAFPRSNHLELPWAAPRNPWQQAFLWIRANTPTDALFALDADYINAPGEDAQCFRAIAERSALPDFSKDGGEASIAPELSAAWTKGQTPQQALSAPQETDAARVAALAPLGVTWVVLRAGAVTRLDCPYANAAVRVCRLR